MSIFVLDVLLVGFFLAPGLLIAVYYLTLVIARLLGVRAWAVSGVENARSFAIVIPAHNEEHFLQQAIEACLQLDYPKDKYEVLVVADNCTDRTADIARTLGATCLERRDSCNPGKGQTLRFAFNKVMEGLCDAVVVLDADCTIDSHALRVFDQCLAEGEHVLQANHIIRTPDAGPRSYAARVGQLIEYNYGYSPKSRLGLAVPLVGTGMVFDTEILRRYPWQASSVVEDIEYTLVLARNGVRVRFIENVAVYHDSEEAIEQLRVQRRRWAGGNLRLGWTVGMRMFLEGLGRGKPLLADLGWTLLTLSRPLVLLHAFAIVSIALLLRAATFGTMSRVWLWGVVALCAAHVAYYLVGILTVGVTWRRLLWLLQSPFVVSELAIISLIAPFNPKWTKRWQRTPR